MIQSRYRQELLDDGAMVKPYREIKQLLNESVSTVRSFGVSTGGGATLWTRRSILRLAMIMQNDVAKQIRTYLLNIEEESTIQQKKEAVMQTGVQIELTPTQIRDLADKRESIETKVENLKQKINIRDISSP